MYNGVGMGHRWVHGQATEQNNAMQTEKNIYTLYKNKTNRFIDFISMFKIPNERKPFHA